MMVEIPMAVVAYFMTGAFVTRIAYATFDMDKNFAVIVLIIWPFTLLGMALYGLYRVAKLCA